MGGSVEYPHNALTEMMERVSMLNAANRGRAGVSPAHTGAAPPSVQSAAMREVQPIEEPLSAEERAELDAKARSLGIVDERLGNTAPIGPQGGDPSQDVYANMSIEEVLAAGASVRPANAPVPMTRTNPQQAAALQRQATPPATVTATPQPRLPNFQNIQGIDLQLGVVYVDDMPFRIPEVDTREFRRYALEVARASIMQQMDEALNLATQETAEDLDAEETEPESLDATVQREPEGDRT